MFSVVEWVRKKALMRLGNAIDERLSRPLFETAHRSNAGIRAPSVLTDFNTLRDFLSGYALTALFDAVWAPVFIVVMAIVHWAFGVIALALILLTAAVAVLNHRLTKDDQARYQAASISAQELS